MNSSREFVLRGGTCSHALIYPWPRLLAHVTSLLACHLSRIVPIRGAEGSTVIRPARRGSRYSLWEEGRQVQLGRHWAHLSLVLLLYPFLRFASFSIYCILFLSFLPLISSSTLPWSLSGFHTHFSYYSCRAWHILLCSRLRRLIKADCRDCSGISEIKIN